VRRIIGSWPYVVVVVLGYAVFWVLLLSWSACSDAEAAGGSCPISSIEFKSLAVTFLYAVVPVVTFATGAVLGFRRGYDVAAVGVGLAVWLVIPEPLIIADRTLSLYWGNKLWFPLVAIAVIGHFGILVGIGIRRLATRRSAADPS
jgi:hypothetical protein